MSQSRDGGHAVRRRTDLVAVGELVEHALRGAEANDRPDLTARLRAARATLAGLDPEAPGVSGAGPVPYPEERAGEVVRGAVEVTARALSSLEVDLRARRAMLADPARAARLRAELADAQDRYARCAAATRDWPDRLGDGFAALGSELDFHLRARTRTVRTEAEAAIEAGDPARDVEPFQVWLGQRLEAETETVYRLLHTGVGRLTERLRTGLQLTAVDRTRGVHVSSPARLVAELPRRSRTAHRQAPIPSRLLTVFMPSYGGVMMTLVVSHFLGLALPGWATAAGALLGAFALGGAALSGERHRQRQQRQGQAIGMVRDTLDDYQLALSQQLRTATRTLQQDLRRAVEDAVTAQRNALADQVDAMERAAATANRAGIALADVDTDLGTLATLAGQAHTLLNSQRPHPHLRAVN
jgi:hypothetical protein